MKMGYTTGAFDMFHVGHLNLLEGARELCDQLLVGVSTDESMLKLKGFTPVVPLDQRMKIVGALKCVWSVIPNEVLDHDQTQKRWGFDLFIIGEDWRGKMDDVERKLKEQCCDVVYLPRTPEVSTTEMKQIINLRRVAFL